VYSYTSNNIKSIFLKGNMVGLIETIWISFGCSVGYCPVWQYLSVGRMELVKQMIDKQVIAVCCLFSKLIEWTRKLANGL